ncbi:ComEA family DNA-binding protein [Halorhodospira halophila]|uniref:Transcriptional regulator, Fis family n=1 Tax=Halorhodospira halophila (strain DSM 244 / SL1) TaxID=349124 RepID=A1WUI2_HALHL|nr:ComEA family DNA-binding protein [Halorhodospira halophila]ABM61344.1 transcriptional regulator, Fis family [Halorhodospira halophila SL1]MBK1729073.1 Fis family transcriptional regulator [Halorhodospira halophila]
MPERFSGAGRALISTVCTATTLLLAGAVQAAGGVDINAASADELASVLNGVGEARAEAIIEEREANGPFQDAEDLSRVSGVGPATLEENREQIRVDGAD